MNSNFYEIARAINFYWPERLPQQLADLEQAFEELKEILKANQLNHPETFKAYCLASLAQINTEYERLQGIYEKKESDLNILNYKYYQREIVFITFMAQFQIFKYLEVYYPETFSGEFGNLQIGLSFNKDSFNKKFQKLLKYKKQQPGTPINPEPTTTEQIFLKFKTKADRENVFDILKVYFEGQKKELLATLENKPTKPLLWPLSTIQLTEFFRRLEYNAVLFNNLTDIKVWLCANFLFEDKGKIKQLNPETVWTYLSKAKGNLSKTKRIGSEIDWLPYLNHDQQKENKKQE
ncbi:MAG: hypothetical protein H0S84_03180 [Bacteroidales bacterium]|nr:hypothetical protein [Bacteroidales bacterium]